VKPDRKRSRPGSRASKPAAPAPGAPGRATGPQPASARARPAPLPLGRDPWAWVSALSVVPLLLHSLGAPLGEPVADDFDFLHRVLYAPHLSLFDGGGAVRYWRPLSRQIYFEVLAPLMLPQPGFIAALHVALLSLMALLLYRALRASLGGPLAALAASFPLLMESTRMLIAWPSNFQDLGAMLFAALAIHEAASARLPTTLVALCASLLCKEQAAPAALLLPWLPAGPKRRSRRRWFLTIAATVALWAVAYACVWRSADLQSPRPAGAAAPSWLASYLWACGNAARATMSLPVDPSRLDALAVVGLLIVGLAAAATATTPAARARFARALPWALWGSAWFAAGALSLALTYPDWLAYRGAFAAIGLGVALAALAGAAHPALVGALLALRLVLFALGPGPPPRVTGLAVERGALLDFPKLVRLQRAVGDTRRALRAGYPQMPTGAQVGLYNLPWMAEFAFGGSKALEVWYRDSTLRWVKSSDFMLQPQIPVVTIVEFEIMSDPCVALVSAAAMRQMTHAILIGNEGDWAGALVRLDRADSLEPAAGARAFHGQVAGVRAVALADLGRLEEAEREARRSAMLYPRNPYAHLALGTVALRRGRLGEADAHVDTMLLAEPNYRPALQLREQIRQAGTGPKR
jgi:tetratricopeptide (TPR) repeat protein